MYTGLSGKSQRLWWNRMQKYEDYTKGKLVGKACSALHVMHDKKEMNETGIGKKISCDRRSGALWVGRLKVAYLKFSKDILKPEVIAVKTECEKVGIDESELVRRIEAALLE